MAGAAAELATLTALAQALSGPADLSQSLEAALPFLLRTLQELTGELPAPDAARVGARVAASPTLTAEAEAHRRKHTILKVCLIP